MSKPENISQNDWFLLCQKYKNTNRIQKKLDKGYPIQYLIGNVDFYGVNISVNKNVLIPRYETELLVSKTIYYIKKMNFNPLKIVDAGTGSGCIAIRLKNEFLSSNIIAYDKSLKALNVAKMNARNNKTDITFKHNKFRDIKEENVHVLISNPPYIDKIEEVSEQVLKYEPHLALFAPDGGIKYYKELINVSTKILNKRSLIAFEIGFTQGKKIKKIAMNTYPNAKVLIEKDLTGKDRYIFIINE